MNAAKQRVVPIGVAAEPEQTKTVSANQKAVDALPLNSGTWRIEGVPGLYVRSRKQSRSYFLQRRVKGSLVKTTIGEVTLKQARAAAMKEWTGLKPKPAGGRKTLGAAFDEYLEQRPLAVKTAEIYRYNMDRYLSTWKDRALEDIGNDRMGVRALYHSVSKKYGEATASQTIRMFAGVYRYARKADIDLPDSPTIAVDLPTIKSRDWAQSPDQLRVWWSAVSKLGPIKRSWWITCLLSGARRGSVEALRWNDIDFDKRTILFRVVKGNRPYMVPASDKAIEWLKKYRESGDVPPSEYVFPSSVKPERHLVAVRDDKRGVESAHHLRHTFRTTLAELGASTDQARMLLGHSMGGDVSRSYITPLLLVESLRPITNAVSARYVTLLGL